MPNCNFNGCYGGPYYPRRINTCSCLNTCSVGQIVNPQVQGEWGVFLLTDETVVGPGETIPVQVSNSNGTAISDSGNGIISLSAGLYEISYSVNAQLPASGEISITLEQDGAAIAGTESSFTGEEGQVVNLSNKIILNFEDATQLTLVNSSSDAVAVELANLTILKL